MRAPSAVDQANTLVAHLGDQIGIPSLKLDEQARCALLVARRWLLSFYLDAGLSTLYLSCPITAAEKLATISPNTWAAMLQTHHLGGALPGAGFSVDPQGRVCVQQVLSLSSTLPAQLVAAVEALIGRATHWSALIAEAAQELQVANNPAAPLRRLHSHV